MTGAEQQSQQPGRLSTAPSDNMGTVATSSTSLRCQAAAYVWTIVLSTLPLVFGWAPTYVSLTSVHVEISGHFVKQEKWERFPPSSILPPVPSPPLSIPPLPFSQK